MVVLTLAPPAAATSTKHEFDCVEWPLAVLDPGLVWFEEGVLHVRNAVYLFATAGDDLCAGQITIVVNLNLDFSDWSGSLWGTGRSELSAFEGGFVQTWNAQFKTADPLNPTATDIWFGRYRGRGYGELEGWQTRATLFERTHALIEESGHAFEPSAP